jgi:hypothetical protein
MSNNPALPGDGTRPLWYRHGDQDEHVGYARITDREMWHHAQRGLPHVWLFMRTPLPPISADGGTVETMDITVTRILLRCQHGRRPFGDPVVHYYITNPDDLRAWRRYWREYGGSFRHPAD